MTSPAAHHALLIFNPHSGRGRARALVQAVHKELRWFDGHIAIAETSGPGHATDLARQAVASGASVVFGMGGDGLLREIATAMIGTSTTLGVLPAGTANVVAISLGVPLDPLHAARDLADAQVFDMDVGVCGNQVFLMVVSGGLDAAIMASVDVDIKKRLGKSAVALEFFSTWLNYEFPTIRLIADGEQLEGTFAAVCNLPYYAGRYRLAPDLDLNDRVLGLVLFQGTSKTATLSFLHDLTRATHISRSDVLYRRVQQVVFPPPQAAPFEVDGDLLTAAFPLQVSLAAEQLKVLRLP